MRTIPGIILRRFLLTFANIGIRKAANNGTAIKCTGLTTILMSLFGQYEQFDDDGISE